jgi:dipeptidyl aminopeptidase/acylaminoacyl peptidase
MKWHGLASTAKTQARIRAALCAALLLVPQAIRAQGTLEDYRRAATIMQRFEGLTTGVVQGLRWVDGTHQAVYRVSVTGGNRFMLVDADQWAKQPAFDHVRVAAALSSATGDAYTEISLPFPSITLVENGTAFEGNVGQSRYRCAVTGASCTRVGAAIPEPGGGRGGGGATPAGAERPTFVVSPDSLTEAIIQNYNVAIRPHRRTAPGEAAGGRGGRGGGAGSGRGGAAAPDYTLLSTDGSEGDAYELNSIVWSPDSKKLVAYRRRPGYDRIVHFVRSSPSDQVQPKLENTVTLGGFTSNYQKPGDVLATTQPALFDLQAKRQLVIDNALFENPYAISRPVWRKDSRAVSFQYNQRGHMVYRVLEVDIATGAVRPMVDEVTKSFFLYSDNAHNFSFDVGSGCRLQGQGACESYTGGELLWMSERDGWNHLYLLDGATGKVKNQITKGEWVVRGIDSVDVVNRQVWFRAGGMNKDQDPYFVHYYRINFDGTGLVPYTEANGTHTLTWSRDRQYYLDSYSRVDLPPVIELKRTSDRRSLTLEKGDMSAAVAAGLQPPEVFVAKARDGRTDIWGIIVRPATFDSNRKYPVIEQIYAGPQGSFVPKTWGGGQNLLSTAELGFVLVQIDGMGTNNRSKAFHDMAWKNLADAGFPDRILWHQAANQKYPWYDITRVGIYGNSAGGQNAAGAVFFHPEFYDAAFASSGCHDNRMDKIWWNEQWMGEMGPHYEASSNVVAAKNLKGHLFLAVGELDTNVDPSSTLQVADALIRAGKDFDLLVVPNGGHGATGPDGIRRRNDFFVRWLLGVNPPDWNSGITVAAPGTPTGLEFPEEEPPPRGFFEEDPTFTYPLYWWW